MSSRPLLCNGEPRLIWHACPKPIRIDFVSDVSCPWCIIGLKELEEALRRVGDLVEAGIHFQPFELNPNMPAEAKASSSMSPRSTARRPSNCRSVAQ
jgi:predicted DsbA family dithiol-disulfide isomerase